FGKSIVSRAPDPNEVRAFNREISAQVTHQVWQGFSVNVGWFNRIWKDVEGSDNSLTTQADWTGPQGVTFQVANPLDPSQMLTAYQLNPAVRGKSFTVDYTDKNYES